MFARRGVADWRALLSVKSAIDADRGMNNELPYGRSDRTTPSVPAERGAGAWSADVTASMTGQSDFDWRRLPSEVRRGFAKALTGDGRMRDDRASDVLLASAPLPDDAFLSHP